MKEDSQIFIVVRFLFIATSATLTGLVLRGLYTSQISSTRPTEAILFSVVLTDAIFCFTGVFNLFFVMLAGGYTKMISQAYGIVSDAVFNMSLIANLLWTAILAAFVLCGGSANFRVHICWLVVWGFAGIYGVAWIERLQTSEKSSQQMTLDMFLVYYLTTCYFVSCALVVITFLILYGRKVGYFGQARRIDAQERLMRYLTIVLSMQCLYVVLIGMGNLPRALKEIAYYLLYSVPGINAMVYGFKQSRWRSKFVNRNLAEELPEEIEIITLEEFIGLSDIAFLAEGASGSVYRAHWLGIDVAMKIIKVPNAGMDADLYQTVIHQTEEAFLDEANICARLRHPNITLFLRMGHYEGKLGILTEFCSRGSLKDVLKKHPPLDWRRKVSLALQISKGLTYLHARNPTYIHRDLKCSNILVTETWQAKLSDFGISKVSTFVNRNQRNGRTGAAGMGHGAGQFEETSFAGTWRWNAPEILVDADHCTYSRATDMYSFGMCLWEIYSDGDIPFAETKFDFEVRQKVLNSERPMIRPSTKCPGKFVELITRCWSQDPKIRPSAPRASKILKRILDSIDLPDDTSTRGYNSNASFLNGSFLTNVGGRSTNATGRSRVSAFLTNFSFLSTGGASNRSDSDRDTFQKFLAGNESHSPSSSSMNNRRRFPMLETLSEYNGMESQRSVSSTSFSTSETVSTIAEIPYVDAMLEAGTRTHESDLIQEDILVLQKKPGSRKRNHFKKRKHQSISSYSWSHCDRLFSGRSETRNSL